MDSVKNSNDNGVASSGRISNFMSSISNRVRTISNSSDKAVNSDPKSSDNYFYIMWVQSAILLYVSDHQLILRMLFLGGGLRVRELQFIQNISIYLICDKGTAQNYYLLNILFAFSIIFQLFSTNFSFYKYSNKLSNLIQSGCCVSLTLFSFYTAWGGIRNVLEARAWAWLVWFCYVIY